MHEEVNLKGWGVASLVFAIFSLVFILIPFIGVLFASLALIFSFVQHDRLSRGAKRIAIVSLLINSILLLMFAAFIGVVMSKAGPMLQDIKSVKDKLGNASDRLESIDQKTERFDETRQGYDQEYQDYKGEQQGSQPYEDVCMGYCVVSPNQCNGRGLEKVGCGDQYCCRT